jgi:hypothetical protein
LTKLRPRTKNWDPFAAENLSKQVVVFVVTKSDQLEGTTLALKRCFN